MMQVTANGRTVSEVLSSFYLIPPFQRPYSWTAANGNVEDFWNDLVESDGDYFIGSMVTFVDDGSLGVVDGQQRLTTITLFLAALRNELVTIGAQEEADGVHTLIERVDPKGRRRFVLKAEGPYPYLQAHVQALPGSVIKPATAISSEELPGSVIKPATAISSEEKRVAEAFRWLQKRVADTSKAVLDNPAVAADKKQTEQVRQLGELRDKLLGLTVVLIEVKDPDDATTIFQTLNSRGQDLAVADLVKSHLLSLLPRTNADLDQARDTWSGLVDLLDESDADISIDRFLLHSWLSRREYTGAKHLFKKIKAHVRSNNAADFLDALAADAQSYRQAVEPEFGTYQRPQLAIKNSLNALRLFKVSQPLPFVLAVVRAYAAKEIPLATAITALQGVESYHYVATAVTNMPSSGGVSGMYALAARRLLEAKELKDRQKVIDDLLTKLRDRLPTQREFTASFVNLRSSKVISQQTPLVRYTLRRLHALTVSNATTVPVDYEQTTLEHLAPQGASVKPDSLTPADVASIGNLILVTQPLNDDLATKSFADKRAILQALPPGSVEELILKAPAWGKVQIEERATALAEAAYQTAWTVPTHIVKSSTGRRVSRSRIS